MFPFLRFIDIAWFKGSKAIPLLTCADSLPATMARDGSEKRHSFTKPRSWGDSASIFEVGHVALFIWNGLK